MTRRIFFFACLACLLLVGCSAEGEMVAEAALTPTQLLATETPIATETPQPTPTPSPTPVPATHTPTPPPSSTPAPTATPQPTETPTATPIPLPPPPGKIVFLWSPELEDDLGPLPQNLYFAKPGNAADEWEMETALKDLHGAGLYLSPDSTKFAVRLFEDTDGNGIVSTMGTADYSNVYLYPLSDKTLTRLTDTEIKGTVQVSWLPDNQQFTYTLNKDIFLFDLANSTSTRLLSFPGLITLHQWSPDGRWLAIVSRLSDEPAPAGESHRLDLYDMETNNLISVVSKLGGSSISWSPNSQWFAFSSIDQGLYATPINDLVPIQLNPDLSFISWSPDGQRLAFASQFGAGNLYLWDPNTQSTQNLLQENGLITAPNWSPDSSRLAVGLIEDDKARLMTVEVSTSVTNTIFTSLKPGEYLWSWQLLKPLNWSPDGKWILFLVFETDKRNMLVINSFHEEAFLVADFTGSPPPNNTYWFPSVENNP